MAKRFFATLQADIAYAGTWPTRAVARTAIFEWIEVWYNLQRRHSVLAYRVPVAHEKQHLLLLFRDLAAQRYIVCVIGSDAGSVLRHSFPLTISSMRRPCGRGDIGEGRM